ncbi:MAG: hypothetical protein GTO03_02710 [Planctomycetales bacterium]|nr:hypothetical protein [Planctomycetales bacterium]
MTSDNPPPADPPAGSLAHYLLLFAACGLLGLVIISTKYERRQAKIEQRFHGIQQMQRDAGGEGAGQPRVLRTPEGRPLIITLRPLMIVVAAVTLVAWLVVRWLQPPRRPAPDQPGHRDPV